MISVLVFYRSLHVATKNRKRKYIPIPRARQPTLLAQGRIRAPYRSIEALTKKLDQHLDAHLEADWLA